MKTLVIAGFWAGLAFCTYAALAPSPPEAAFRISDVVLHAIAFVYLTTALAFAHLPYRLLLVGALMLAYGAAIEVVQSLIVERSAELKDLGVDAIGIAVALCAVRLTRDWAIRVFRLGDVDDATA